ncbi:Tn3 family transposase, partial [Escherichia coli]
MLKKHPFCGAFLVFWGFKFLSIKMAESSPGLTYAKLSWLQAWHIRDETYSAALAELVNHQYRHA